MDKCTALKSHLDNLMKTMDVGTWNSHGNEKGVFISIRLKYKEAILFDSTTSENRIAFKRKTPYQMNRDRVKLQKLKERHDSNAQIEHSKIEMQRCEAIEAETPRELDPSLCLSPEAVMPTVLFESSTPIRMAEEYQAISSIHECDLELESECLGVLTTELSTPTVMIVPSDSVRHVTTELEMNTENSIEMLDTFSLPESITPDVSFSTEPDPTCCICNAIPPSGTELNACGSCDALLCGHCALTHTFPHSSKCDLLRAP